MIKSFSDHLRLYQEQCGDAISSVFDISMNVYRYYSQFLPQIETAVDKKRKPIMKDLKDYVQIATWKDVNVYALKESAKRSHYQLTKYAFCIMFEISNFHRKICKEI
jgi:midasin